MTNHNPTIRWAPRVPQNRIRRLYEMDASRIVDETLVDDVGVALLWRCETIQRVTERRCPECGEALHDPGPKTDSSRTVSCPRCHWQATWKQHHRAYKTRRIHGGRAYPAFLRGPTAPLPPCPSKAADGLTGNGQK